MSSAKKVTLTNSQRTAITISISTNLADFKQSNNCPSTLSAGSSCAISVMFTPAALGFRIGTLNINDTGAGGPQTGVLSGTGVAVTAAPSSLSFGNQPVGQKSAASLVTVTNNQSKNLSIASITTNLADYRRLQPAR